MEVVFMETVLNDPKDKIEKVFHSCENLKQVLFAERWSRRLIEKMYKNNYELHYFVNLQKASRKCDLSLLQIRELGEKIL
jgi:hypothetical protein